MKITQQEVQIDPEKDPEIYLFAHEEGCLAPIGLTVLGLDSKEESGWVSRVWVSPAVRRKGVGRQLVTEAVELSRARGKRFVSLAVANGNEGAQQLYKSLGFVPFMTGQEGYMQYLKTL